MYALDWHKAGRRAGLTRAGYKAPSLLQTINAPNKQNAIHPNPPQRLPEEKMKSAKEDLSDKDILALPKDESDDSSDEEDIRRAADIKPTQFAKRASEEPKPRPLQVKGRSSQDNKSIDTSISSNITSGTKGTNGTGSSKQKLPSIDSTSSLAVSNSNKRKKDGGASTWCNTVDPFGQVVDHAKKARTTKITYTSHQKSKPTRTQGKASQESPKFKRPASLDLDSPVKSNATSPQGPRFKKMDTTQFGTPEKAGRITPLSPIFKKPDTSEFDSPPRSNTGSPLKPTLRKVDTSGLGSPLLSSLPPKTAKPPVEEPLTQLPAFKKFDVTGDLVGRAHDILGRVKHLPSLVSTQFDDDDISTSQVSLCPMCRKPVNTEELRKCGEMNTRQQEKFCREHQRKDAKEDWSSKGYPEIDWSVLDARIAVHHAFIKTLVNGADSHYRAILDATVKAGKDRTLLKSETNLTPGYYGSRGLRAISENIMHEFTPLLKRRVVKDRLMAARGVTGFVQSVLVPEVTILLIMDDMNIMIDEARNVLKESMGMGELVNEEIRDVVVRRVEDSDDEDDGVYD